MSRSFRLGVVLFLSLVLVFASGSFYLAPVIGSEAELQNRQRELEKVSREIELRQKQLEEAKKEQKTVVQQINVLEADIDKTEAEIQYLNKKLQVLDSQIQVAKKELERAQAAMEERCAILAQRLKSIYQNGEVSYLEVLLDSTSFADFLSRFDLLQKIADQDVVLIKEIEKEQQIINTRKIELETAYLQVESVKEEAKQKQAYLKQQTAEKEKALKEIEQDKAAVERALNQLEQDSKRLERIIRDLQAKSSSDKPAPTGKLLRPISGAITSDYGMRIHPILKEKRMHTGIDLRGAKGTPIKAAESGTVIFTGWMGAYGQVVIIDHGGGLSTMYAHQSSILVTNGQKVARGEIIGKVGSTGWSTGPHLHFEVRKNGTPVNPHDYL
ncbi:MAG: peptidoglycan DD-metalloendopeptidase family protein [Syntrophomonadaceae bacterium]|nr:peptidoglycan DD-metalloendopeptidase family protein [Syntrophomonadaceae bacterium]